MAGIGFELRRVISQGGTLTNIVRALASGVFIVAGPWILTVLTIAGVNWFSGVTGMQTPALFQAIVTITYAVSLIVFSPVQYFFTRLISDLVWKDEKEQAVWFLLWTVASTAGAAGLATWLITGFVPLPGESAALRLVWAALAASISALWIAMLFISVLKWYGRVLGIYLLGTAATFGLMLWGEQAGDLLGILGALAAGNGLITVGLLGLSWASHRPRRPEHPASDALTNLGRKGWLILAGFLYALGLWLDKFFFWGWKGTQVGDTGLRLYEPYDSVVYQSSATLIPGLVFFIIVTETAYATAVVQFIQALTTQPYRQIRQRQFELSHSAGHQWWLLAGFQGLMVLGLISVSLFTGQPPTPGWLVGLGGTGAQLLLMASLTFCFYLELYRDAALLAAGYVAAGVAGCLLQVALPGLPPGTGFLGANLLMAVAAQALLGFRIRSIDRILFSR